MPERLLDVARHAHQRAAVLAQLALGRLQRLGDALQRDVEALLEALRLEEAQLLGALVAPLLARAPEQVAGRVALAHAAVLEDVDLLAVAAADVAAGEAADGPAHRHVGAAEVQQVLLRLVGGDEHRRPSCESGPVASRLDAEEALAGRGCACRRGASPRRCPTLNSACIASAMRQPWAKPNWVSTVRAAVRPKFSTRYLRSSPIATASSEQRALPGEADHAPFRVELQQLLVIEILGAHGGATLSISMNGPSS